MPALRVFCYDGCSSAQRRDRNGGSTRLLLSWMADDDLRVIAKYSILLRCMQLLILIPTLAVLIQTHLNIKHLFSTVTTTTTSTSSTTQLSSVPCSIRKPSIIVWFFWSSSFITVIGSIVLEIFMYVDE
jgi:hypothetical protein